MHQDLIKGGFNQTKLDKITTEFLTSHTHTHTTHTYIYIYIYIWGDGYRWSSKDELISEIILWSSTHK